MRRFGIVAVVLVLAAVSTASAGDWNMFGPRTLGMGGAGASSARGAWSLMLNPAGLAEPDEAARISLSFGADIRDLGLSDAIDALADYDWERIQGDPTSSENAAAVNDIVAQLRIMNEKALMVGVGGGLFTTFGKFGIGVNGGFRAAFSPRVDLVNIVPIASNVPNSFAYNTSKVAIVAMTLAEVPIGYARKFEVGKGSMSVGGTVKIMRGATYSAAVDPTTASTDEFRDEINDSEKTSVNLGFDLGAIYHPPYKNLSFGLVARNINSPKFDTIDGGEVSEDAQIRVGGELALFNRLLSVAVDADLNKRGTILDGYGPNNEQYKEQWIGGGISLEGSPWIFETALRLGVMQNMADSELGMIYTGGLSIGFKWLHVSLSGAVSQEESEVVDAKYPAGASVMLAIESTW
jgi:hypothetical protein